MWIRIPLSSFASALRTGLISLILLVYLAAALPASGEPLTPPGSHSTWTWTQEFDNNWVSGTVYASQVVGDSLYVAGQMRWADGVSAERIALWANGEWHALGTGLDSFAMSLAVYKGCLYVGGYFSMAGGVQAWSLARWDGAGWEGCGAFDAPVIALLVHDGLLYVAGAFYFIGSTYYGEIAAFDGEEWSSVGGGMNGNVLFLAEYDGKLVAGGDFSRAGSVSARRIALWDGQAWSALGTGVDEYPNCAIEYEGALVVGGTFEEAGLQPARHLAVWDGARWEEFPGGVGSVGTLDGVSALLLAEGGLLVGGQFNSAGGLPAESLAWWNGSTWSPCTSGVDGRVREFAHWAGGIMVGGYFTGIEHPEAHHIAHMVAEDLTAIGPGGDSNAAALALSCWPNPFNPATTISFALPRAMPVRLEVFDLTGREVFRFPLAGEQGSGPTSLTWNGRDGAGRPLAAGIYLVRLSTPEGSREQKLVLAK